jgi:hypothetical protein
MDILTQELLAPSVEESENSQKREVDTTPFPLWWLHESKRNFDGLPDILAHLENKMTTFQQIRAGFIGEATPMEKQIIERLGQMEQAVYHLGDSVQCAIQIVKADHDARISQRIKRACLKTLNTIKRGWKWLLANPFYNFLALVSTILTFGAVLLKVFHR